MHECLSAYGLVELSTRAFQYYFSTSTQSIGKAETGRSSIVAHVDDDDVNVCDAGAADRFIKAELEKVRLRVYNSMHVNLIRYSRPDRTSK